MGKTAYGICRAKISPAYDGMLSLTADRISKLWAPGAWRNDETPFRMREMQIQKLGR